MTEDNYFLFGHSNGDDGKIYVSPHVHQINFEQILKLQPGDIVFAEHCCGIISRINPLTNIRGQIFCIDTFGIWRNNISWINEAKSDSLALMDLKHQMNSDVSSRKRFSFYLHPRRSVCFVTKETKETKERIEKEIEKNSTV